MANYSEFKFIGDRFLEEFTAPVPDNVLEWLKEFKGVQEEHGYPATLNGEYGFAFTAEFWHSDMEDEIAGDWIKSHPDRTSVMVYSDLIILANNLEGQNPDLVFSLGKNKGPLECHELIAFFKSGASQELYSKFYVMYNVEMHKRFGETV
jgi:hypothetical protein